MTAENPERERALAAYRASEPQFVVINAACFRAGYDAGHARAEQLERELQSAAQEANDLNRTVERLTQELAAERERCKGLQERLGERATPLEFEHQQLRADRAESALAAERAELQSAAQEANDLNRTVERLTQELAAERERYANHMNEANSKWQDTWRETESALAAERAELQRCREQYEEAAKDRDFFDSERMKVVETLTAAEAVIERLKRARDRLALTRDQDGVYNAVWRLLDEALSAAPPAEVPDPAPPAELERVTHDEARNILSRFNASHWNNPGEHARYSIPANPKRDDDLRLAAYIDQCRADSAELSRLRTALGEVCKLRQPERMTEAERELCDYAACFEPKLCPYDMKDSRIVYKVCELFNAVRDERRQQTKGATEPDTRLPGSVRTPGTAETSVAPAELERELKEAWDESGLKFSDGAQASFNCGYGTARSRSQQELDRLRDALDTAQERIVKLQGALAAAQESLGEIRGSVDRVERTPIDRVIEIKSILTKAGA